MKRSVQALEGSWRAAMARLALAFAIVLHVTLGSLLTSAHFAEMSLLASLGLGEICRPGIDGGPSTDVPGKLPSGDCECCGIACSGMGGVTLADAPQAAPIRFELATLPVPVWAPGHAGSRSRFPSDITSRGPPATLV
jgi:hypothetical protein